MIYVLIPLFSWLLALVAFGVGVHHLGKVWGVLAFGPALKVEGLELGREATKGFGWLCGFVALLVAGAWFWGL